MHIRLLEKESILESKIFRVHGMSKAAFFGSTVKKIHQKLPFEVLEFFLSLSSPQPVGGRGLWWAALLSRLNREGR